MPASRYDGTENMRQPLTVKNEPNPAYPAGGSDVGGMDNLRAESTTKEAANKGQGPTSGPTIGGTTSPDATVIRGGK